MGGRPGPLSPGVGRGRAGCGETGGPGVQDTLRGLGARTPGSEGGGLVPIPPGLEEAGAKRPALEYLPRAAPMLSSWLKMQLWGG